MHEWDKTDGRIATGEGVFPAPTFFGGDAAVHDPDSVGPAILCFDLFEKVFQGGLVLVLPGITS